MILPRNRRMLSVTSRVREVTMPASPDPRPRRAADGHDNRQAATAGSEQAEAETDETEQSDVRRAEPDPSDEGWEPV